MVWNKIGMHLQTETYGRYPAGIVICWQGNSLELSRNNNLLALQSAGIITCWHCNLLSLTMGDAACFFRGSGQLEALVGDGSSLPHLQLTLSS